MKKLRQILTWMLLLSMLLSMPVFAAEEKIAVYQNMAHISINGSYMNAQNYAIDGNLYVPLRAVSEGFGYEINWNEDRSIDLTAAKTQEPKLNTMEFLSPPTPKAASFMVYKDDLTIRVNGAVFETPHFLYKGTTYVPLQFFYDALKCHIYEDHSLGVVKIYSPEYVSFGENEVFYYDGQILTKEQYEDALVLLAYLMGSSELSHNAAEQEFTYLRYITRLSEKITDDADFQAFLEANKVDELLEQLAVKNPEVMKESILKAIFYQSNIAEQEVYDYYISTEEDLQTELQNSKYATGKWMKAKHILIMSDDEKSAKDQAEEILAKLQKNPEDFDKLMAEYSQDPGSKTYPEGYLFKEGDMVTEFYEGALALEAGEISEIVESPYGYHIIQKVADYENGVPYTEVKDELHQEFARKEFIKEGEQILANINTVLNRDYLEQPEK